MTPATYVNCSHCKQTHEPAVEICPVMEKAILNRFTCPNHGRLFKLNCLTCIPSDAAHWNFMEQKSNYKYPCNCGDHLYEVKPDLKVKPVPAAQATFDRAAALISGPRRTDYGGIQESFTHIAQVWSGILRQPITPSQVALCMVGLKLCRESNGHKQDSIDDAVGYLGILAELEANLTQSSPQQP